MTRGGVESEIRRDSPVTTNMRNAAAAREVIHSKQMFSCTYTNLKI